MMEVKKILVLVDGEGSRQDNVPTNLNLLRGDTVDAPDGTYTIAQVNHALNESETVVTTTYVAMKS